MEEKHSSWEKNAQIAIKISIFFFFQESTWSRHQKAKPRNQPAATNGSTTWRFVDFFFSMMLGIFFTTQPGYRFSRTAPRTQRRMPTRSSRRSWRRPALCGRPCPKPRRANTSRLLGLPLRSKQRLFNRAPKRSSYNFLVPLFHKKHE